MNVTENREDQTATLSWDDGFERGVTISRTVNLSIPDIQKFKGRPGYVWLLIAANPHLSINDMIEWLFEVDPKSYRPHTWIAKRRWMFHEKFQPGARANQDGKDERARKIMADNKELSLRDMVRALADRGIRRGKDWVRVNRYG
jgi:hypothetical protein